MAARALVHAQAGERSRGLSKRDWGGGRPNSHARALAWRASAASCKDLYTLPPRRGPAREASADATARAAASTNARRIRTGRPAASSDMKPTLSTMTKPATVPSGTDPATRAPTPAPMLCPRITKRACSAVADEAPSAAASCSGSPLPARPAPKLAPPHPATAPPHGKKRDAHSMQGVLVAKHGAGPLLLCQHMPSA